MTLPITLPIIAFDFDDVVMPFLLSFVQWHNHCYHTTLAYADFFTFKMSDVLQIDEGELYARLDQFMVTDYHHDAAPPAHTADMLGLLSTMYTLHIVTARNEKYRAVTLRWIERFTPGVFSEVHILSGEKKSRVCQEIGAVVLIDDALHNAEDVAQVGIPVLLLNTPWNQGNLPTGVTRIYELSEVFAWHALVSHS